MLVFSRHQMLSWAQSPSNSTCTCHCRPWEKRDLWVFRALSKPSHCVAAADCGSPGHAAVTLLAVGKRRRFRKNGTFGQSSVWDRVATHQFISGMSCSIFILLFSWHHTCPRTPPKLPVSQVVTVKLLSCPSAEGRARHLHASCLPQWQQVSRSLWVDFSWNGCTGVIPVHSPSRRQKHSSSGVTPEFSTAQVGINKLLQKMPPQKDAAQPLPGWLTFDTVYFSG